MQTDEVCNGVVAPLAINFNKATDANILNVNDSIAGDNNNTRLIRETQNWNLIWQDEFDNTSINSAKWTYDIGGGGWGNNELQYYTNRPENAKIVDGNLLIIARKESYGGREYTSARLKTQGLFSFTYGKIEARIKLPMGKGIWPAFWMLGTNISTIGWPKCGEIDIMEHINNEDKIHATMHWDVNGHAYYGGSTICDVTKFHIYSVEWDSKAIKWFLDGNKFWEGNILNNINGTEEFHLPFFIILNMAVGGNWPGNPDGTTLFPDTMYVDYVRVYQSAIKIDDSNSEQYPKNFNLFQNYPNPFNPTTTITFKIPTQSFVTLKVFDSIGREISNIISDKLPAGTFSRQWNAAGITSGIYFYRLQSRPIISGQFSSYIETRKMILLR